ncbi:MAG: FAD-binding oxidoreductase, partial [Fervidicoccus fontis]
MLKSKKTIAKDLSSIVSDGNVITDESTIKVYAKNASHMEGNAIAVVFPNNTEEVSEIVKYCYKNNIKIYPQASASELTGSSLPREDGVIVSFERMNKIKNINILDSYVVVEPGVRLYDLNLELSIYGFMFPIDPASIKIATVGGAINTGAGGMRGVKYGTMKDWVNELEIVIPNEYGTILKIGCKTSKCRQGYDLVRLIVGSEGTLALVTEATLKITPLPENVITLAAFFDDIEGLVNALLEIKKNKLDILIMEFVDDKSVELTLKVLKINIAGNGHYFVTSIITSPESSERVLSLVENILKRNGAKNVYKAKTLDEAESEGIFDIRRNYDIGLRDLVVKMRKNPASKIIDYNEDISVPPSKLPEAVRRI